MLSKFINQFPQKIFILACKASFERSQMNVLWDTEVCKFQTEERSLFLSILPSFIKEKRIG
jgi:hypothetical protein